MKTFLRFFFPFLALCMTGLGRTQEADSRDKPLVYLIPVRQAIFQPQLYLLRRGVRQAIEAEADAVVLLMDTPGGSVKIMEEMVSQVIDLDIPTYTLVEKDAISAGAIIAMSTDKIYMTPLSKIGDAMPVMMGPNGYQEMGENEREKIESYMDAVVRSIAQHKGRDEDLIQAMVRRNREFTLSDGTVISPEGEILTLTFKDAELELPEGGRLLSEGTVEDLDEMLEIIGFGDAERIELQVTPADEIAKWITKLSPLLLGLALLLGYIELQAPGIGWAGAGAVVLLGLMIFGHNIAGLAGSEDLVLILLGVVLILVEILILPGFGVAGISGILLFIAGLIRAMTLRNPGNPGDLPGFENVANLDAAFLNLSLAVIGAAVMIALAIRSLGENNLMGRKLVLSDALHADLEQEPPSLVGKVGKSLTPLRPSGSVELEGKSYDAISDGGYIDPEQSVRVLAVQNHRLQVTLESGENA